MIYLDVDGAVAWERARGEGRPLAQDADAFERLLAGRRATYERTADWIIPVGDLEVEEVAREVVAVVTKRR